jgi:nucleotide-binding universal stress UspA family protein
VAGATDVEIDYDVSVGDPADFLVAASERLDLLICGSRGYGPARSVMLGGVSRRVTTEAHCPVIVLARGTEAGLEALIDEATSTAG